MKNALRFIIEITRNRKMLLNLTKNDLKSKYTGSALGIAWAFIQPITTIFVFWLVFQLGFKNPPVKDIPFILWFISAYIPWYYFSEVIQSSSGTLYEYSYLVKKIKFKVELLPIIKVLSALFVHLIFIVIIVVLQLIYGYGFQPIYFQALYFTFALSFLLVGLALFISAVSVFFKDFTQLIAIALQLGFWVNPIIWATSSMNPNIVAILRLNPLFYIIEGYRNTFIMGVPFYADFYGMIYFWAFSIFIFVAGIATFKKLNPHFADIL